MKSIGLKIETRFNIERGLIAALMPRFISGMSLSQIIVDIDRCTTHTY